MGFALHKRVVMSVGRLSFNNFLFVFHCIRQSYRHAFLAPTACK